MKNQEEEVKVISSEVQTNETITEKKGKFLNPFDKGVTYAEFQKALGKKSVAEYCKEKLSDEQIAFLEIELSILKTE